VGFPQVNAEMSCAAVSGSGAESTKAQLFVA
jgi:hypothetical protein